MLGFTVKVEDKFTRVKAASDEAAFKNFGHAAASIRKTAAGSIRRSKRAGAAGGPPTTRRGQLRRAFRFDVSQEDAIVGPRYSIVGAAGAAHEFGGEYRGDHFDRRPFMLPALLENLDRFAGEWAGSIGD